MIVASVISAELVEDREQEIVQRHPRVLIAGNGEPHIEEICAALTRRGIDPILANDPLEVAIGIERPNLVLLVGDASTDDGARGIDVARRAGPTPAVVATDPEPFDRRLAPFQYGACGIVVRRNEPEEMAGEIHHLLAENARRIEERVRAGQSATELDSLVGLVSRDLRMSATPHEGLSRIAARSLLRAHEERSKLEAPVGPKPLARAQRSDVLTAELARYAASDDEAEVPEVLKIALETGDGSRPPWSERPADEDRISASMLLAIAPPTRPPIEDRASPLRARVQRKPRASAVPALAVLALTLFTTLSLVLGRIVDACR